MQSGELIVTGKDQVVIKLDGPPAEVKCYFKDDIEVVPCSPHHADALEYEVVEKETFFDLFVKFVLVIKWNVHDVRTIIWEAAY